MVCVKAIGSKDVRYCDEKMETRAGCYLTSHRSHAPLLPHRTPSCHYLLLHSDLQSSQTFQAKGFLFYLLPRDPDSFQLARKRGEECPQRFPQEERGPITLFLPVSLITLKGESFGCSCPGFFFFLNHQFAPLSPIRNAIRFHYRKYKQRRTVEKGNKNYL